ncbi:MAG: hypothetical protein CL756_01790 [Chloroflexi bacterium]|nr:hypothetical protein [Chloroflexota bacterium]
MFINPYIEPEQNIKKDGYLGSFISYKSIGSISVKAFQIYKNKYPQLFPICLISIIPMLFMIIFYSEEFVLLFTYILLSSEDSTLVLPSTFGLYFLLILHFLLIPLVDAAMVIAVGRVTISHDTNILNAYYLALTRGYSLILNSVIYVLLFISSVILTSLIIGYPLIIILLTATVIFRHAIYFENSGPGFALFRSIKLLLNSWLDLFKFWVPILGLYAIVIVSSTYVYEGFLAVIFNLSLLVFVFLPLKSIIISLAYIHYRIKFENLSYIDYGNSVLNLGKPIEE